MFHNVAADEKLDDGNETALQDNENVDCDENSSGSLHTMTHNRSNDCQNKDEKSNNLGITHQNFIKQNILNLTMIEIFLIFST